jgi:hypothetical protein
VNRKNIFLAQMLGITLLASWAGAPIVGVPVIPIVLIVCGWRYVAYYLSIFTILSLPNFMSYLNPLISMFELIPKATPANAVGAVAGSRTLFNLSPIARSLLMADIASILAAAIVIAFTWCEYRYLKNALKGRVGDLV